jgi:hypothetical protein
MFEPACVIEKEEEEVGNLKLLFEDIWETIWRRDYLGDG